jgi:hypothetical protein
MGTKKKKSLFVKEHIQGGGRSCRRLGDKDRECGEKFTKDLGEK